MRDSSACVAKKMCVLPVGMFDINILREGTARNLLNAHQRACDGTYYTQKQTFLQVTTVTTYDIQGSG